MVDHPFRTAAAATNGVYDDELLEAGVLRTILVLDVDESLGDFEFTVGEIPLAVAWATTGFVYYYDATDATTPDDGLTTLVTGNGLRYAVEDAASISLNSALDVVTVPTGSEVTGDTYIVAAAATGAFAGQDDNLAVLTRRGWVFAVPEIGMTVLNEATGQNTQFTDAGWGAFAVAFADGSIPPKALQFPAGIVVEDTLNAPPGAPTAGKFWIVGSVPSGAFVGHGADLAYWTGSAWAFMDPADGWAVFHKANGFEVFYVSGAWLGAAGSDLQTFSTAGSFSWTKPARGKRARVQVWAGGGSGGRASSNDGGGGGGGGGYIEWEFDLADLAATETVTVGPGGPAITANETNGIAGGNSSFGAWLTAYGGGPGNGVNIDSGGGGGGGGLLGPGAAGTADSAVSALGGIGTTAATQGGVGGNSSARDGVAAENGGGGGGSSGTGGSGGTNGGSGGRSTRGGAGGGGAGIGGGSVAGAGGVSLLGGNGGNGGVDATPATAGAQPGGGGGGSETANSGKGGDGRVRVTVY